MSFVVDDVFSIGQPALPGNSQYTYLYDSTYFGYPLPALSTSLNSTLGVRRYVVSGRRVEGTILCTGQNVTCVFQILDGSGAWVTDTNAPDSGTKTVTATVIYPFRWLPVTPDHRIYILAGGTGPTTLVTTCNFIRQRTSGV